MIALLTERRRYTTAYSAQRTFLTVPGRVANALLHLASVYADPLKPSRIEVTQQELANFAGATRAWVHRALHDFAALNLIQIERGAILILDRADLQRALQ